MEPLDEPPGVVETGLAADGDPLADGDDDDGYECGTDVDECGEKCLESGSPVCYCAEQYDLETGEVTGHCCCFGARTCDFCGGNGGGGEGCGEEGEEGEGPEGGEGRGPVRLSCDQYERRGSTAGCEVVTTLDTDSLSFEWWGRRMEPETGWAAKRWMGTATHTRDVSVTVRDLRSGKGRWGGVLVIARHRPRLAALRLGDPDAECDGGVRRSDSGRSG